MTQAHRSDDRDLFERRTRPVERSRPRSRPTTGAERKAVGIEGTTAWRGQPTLNQAHPKMPPSRRSLRRSRDGPTKPSSAGMRAEERLGKRQSKHDDQWNARFKELLSYRSEQHGDCNIPTKQGLKEAASTAWATRFEELVQYKAKHGDCDVPARQGKLGKWVCRQRAKHKGNSLEQGRIDQLNSMGFKWALVEKGPKMTWEARFEELVRYKTAHGDCDVPQKQGKLGGWVKTQRKVYKADSLAQDRIDRLNSIGFMWALLAQSAKVPWETRFNELVQYKTKHGDCNVPQRQGPLGKWVHHQRCNYKEGKLSQDRINRLNDIGFEWTLPRRGGRKRKAPPSTRMQSLSRKERVSSPSTNVNSPSVGDGARDVGPNEFKGEGCNTTSVLSLLKVPFKRSNRSRGTESDDEVDEIGALIYDQAMRQRTTSQAGRGRRKRDRQRD